MSSQDAMCSGGSTADPHSLNESSKSFRSWCAQSTFSE